MKISNFLNEIFFRTLKKREDKKKVVKLISPNSGKIVTLKILTNNPNDTARIVNILCTLKSFQNTIVTVSKDNIVTINFEDSSNAQAFREAFLK